MQIKPIYLPHDKLNLAMMLLDDLYRNQYLYSKKIEKLFIILAKIGITSNHESI